MNYIECYRMMKRAAEGYAPAAPEAPQAPAAPEGGAPQQAYGEYAPQEPQQGPSQGSPKVQKVQLAPELLQMYPYLSPDSAIGKSINPADRKQMEQYAQCMQELMQSQDPNNRAYMQNIDSKIHNIYDKAMRAL